MTAYRRGALVSPDLRIENPETIKLLAGQAGVFTEHADNLRPTVARLADEVEQLEAKLRVLRPQLAKQSAQLHQAEAEARDLVRIIEASCAANNLPLPIPRTGQETSAFEAVAAPERETPPEASSGGWAPVDPATTVLRPANGPDRYAGLAPDVLDEEAKTTVQPPVSDEDDRDDSDDEPPAEGDKPKRGRTVQQMRDKARDVLEAVVRMIRSPRIEAVEVP